jgi:hypothetical protein
VHQASETEEDGDKAHASRMSLGAGSFVNRIPPSNPAKQYSACTADISLFTEIVRRRSLTDD